MAPKPYATANLPVASPNWPTSSGSSYWNCWPRGQRPLAFVATSGPSPGWPRSSDATSGSNTTLPRWAASSSSMGGVARSPAGARNSGTKKPSGAGKRSAGRHSKKGQGRRPDHRLRRRDRLLPVTSGGQDLCPQGPDSSAPGTPQPRPSLGDQRHYCPGLAAHQDTRPALPECRWGAVPGAPDHPDLGAAAGDLGWQPHPPVPGGQSLPGEPSWAGGPSGAGASLCPRVEP